MPQKYVSSLTLRLGPITTVGSLTGVRKSVKKTKPSFKFVTPDGKPVQQRYVDDAGNVFKQADLAKAAVVKDDYGDESLVPVSKQEVERAKKSTLPKDVVSLTVHNAQDVERNLFPADSNGYVFTPEGDDPANQAWYDLLYEVVSTSDHAFLSTANVRNHEGLYRLSAWNGQLVLQRVLYPHEVNEYVSSRSATKIDKSTFKKARNMVESLVRPFDPDEYRDSVSERLAEVERAFVSGEAEYTPGAKPVDEKVEFDLSAALDAFGQLLSHCGVSVPAGAETLLPTHER